VGTVVSISHEPWSEISFEAMKIYETMLGS
jgi:hypothetical protein